MRCDFVEDSGQPLVDATLPRNRRDCGLFHTSPRVDVSTCNRPGVSAPYPALEGRVALPPRGLRSLQPGPP